MRPARGVTVAMVYAANPHPAAIQAQRPRMMRVGIVDPVEVFLTWGGFSVDRDSTAGVTVVETGSTDLLLGAKFAVLDESRHGLTLTVEPTTTLPIGSDDFSTGSYDGAVRLIQIQREGKKPMSAEEFLRGTPVKAGTRVI